jgi:transposase-like protein
MNRRRRGAEEWRRILEDQREQGLSDRECSALHGIDPSSLRRWRGRLGWGGSRALSGFVELPVAPSPVGELRIILPNRFELAIGPGWPLDQVASLAGKLAVL